MADAQPNRYLTGAELREIIMNDVRSVLDQDGMLAHHIAYKRAAFSITVKVMTDNPMLPNGAWSTETKSRLPSIQQKEATPSLEALETFPLAGERSDDYLDLGRERTREIVSPNHSRIENDLPIKVTFRTSEGDVQEKDVLYEKDMLPDDDEVADKIIDRDLTPAEITGA